MLLMIINTNMNQTVQMQQTEKQQAKQVSQKINYKEKNLDYLERIKEKKQKELQQRALQQKKQQQRRQNLKRKILVEASKNRQLKQSKNNHIEEELQPRKNSRKRTNMESLPKINNGTSQKLQHIRSKGYQQRYIAFIQNLHLNNKSKKEIQELEKKKKQQKYAKMKQGLCFNNVESKLAQFRTKKQQESYQMPRTHSAQKFENLIKNEQNSELPKTNKNFSKKNQEYLQKIKRKREQQFQLKEEEKKKKDKLKDNLKNFVMTTVKKNVLDGVYDDEDIKKPKLVKKETRQPEEQESSSEQQKTQQVKKPRKMRAFPYITDLSQWKKKNRIEQKDKVFILTGGYGQLKKALKERGWFQNPDPHSPCFDLKYTLQSRQIDYQRMNDHQLANHFQKAGCITTKVGLTKSLKNLVWIKDVSQDNFYPKCFDLNDEDDYVGFELHFKICKALSIIKIYSDFVREGKKKEKKEKQKELIQDLKLRTEVAINVCKKNVEDLDEIIDRKKNIKVVTDKQWEILASDELNQESLAKKKHQQWLKSIDCKFNATSQQPKAKKEKKKKKEVQEEKNVNQKQQESDDDEVDVLFEEGNKILQDYESRYPQFHIIGHNNIWILKPAGLSRGRGITCYNNLVQIQDHVKCKQSQWIAQKYIQNPLVILRRKFDIRQWVLVTDFNPLTIWLYEQTYVRFSATDYNAKQISNKFIHLTNNAIGSHSKRVQNSHIKGNMFFQDQFASFLSEKEGSNIYEQKIKPQIKQIVKYSLMCAVQSIQNRKNSHQLYGYDLMVDEDYKVWLIQINSSPSMDYSTHVTTKLVKDCLHDIVKVVVDYPSVPKKERKNVDTGMFKKIYKGIQVPDKPINTGLNLCIEGVPMKKPKRNTVKVTNFSLDGKKAK